nr:hypothetical protein [Paracoccus saliphilus]
MADAAQGWLVNALYIAISVLMVEASFRWFESRFLTWKHRPVTGMAGPAGLSPPPARPES